MGEQPNPVTVRKQFKAYTMGITAEHEKVLASELKSMDRPSRRDLREALENHALWLDCTDDAAADAGARADFSGKNLEYAELVDARLTDACLPQSCADVTATGMHVFSAEPRE